MLIKELLNEDGQSLHVSKNGRVFLNGVNCIKEYINDVDENRR